MPWLGSVSGAVHWYSETAPTVIDTRVAVCVFVRLQVPDVTAPHWSDPVVADRSVAQLTLTVKPTRSVKYGARVKWELNAAASAVTGASTTEPNTRSAATRPATIFLDERLSRPMVRSIAYPTPPSVATTRRHP